MRRVLLLASAIVFVDTMFFAALTPLLPHYADRFDLSKAGAGVLAAAYPVGVLLGGLPSGLLTARIGPKATASLGMTLVAVTSVAFGFAGSIVLLDAARLAQGIGSACSWTAMLSWLVAVAPANRRGAVIGRTMAFAIGGAIFGPVLGGIASLVGTAEAFSAVAVLALALVAVTLLTRAPAMPMDQPIGRVRSALHDRRILMGLWLVALPALLFGTTTLLVPLRLSELGLGGLAIGGIFLAAVALEACTSPIAGRMADRRGSIFPLSIGLAASAVGAAVLPWPQGAALLGVVVVLCSAAFGVFWVPAMAMLADAAERIDLHPAWAFALMNLAWAPAQTLGSAGGGAIARATSDAVPYLLLSAACILTFPVLRRMAVARSTLEPLGREAT